MDQIKIGKFIANCRKDKNLTQSDLAELLGVSNRTISKWETGRGMPDLSMFKLLCDNLDITYNELLNGERIDEINSSYEQTIERTINYTDKQLKKQNFIIDILYILVVSLLIFIFSYFWKSSDSIYGGIFTSFIFMALSCFVQFISFVKKDLTNLFSIVSFAFCLISLLNLYHLTYHFCSLEDFSALLDTVPATFFLSKFCAIVTIVINIILCIINNKRKKST